MPTYKLTYFPSKGRAEAIRYLFHYKGVDFEDKRIPREEWPTVKSEFKFGQVPALHVDGKELCQLTAICRYLANEFGLTGKDAFEKAQADQFVDGVMDIMNPAHEFAMATIAGDEQKAKAAYQEYRAGPLKTGFAQYEKFLAQNGTGYLVGSSLTWADIFLAEFVHRLCAIDSSMTPNDDVIKDTPGLKKHCDMVHALPGIAEYVAGRPQTEI